MVYELPDMEALVGGKALPPNNVEAEETILGGILLDPEAMQRVAEIITDPRAFYLSAHQEIYRVALKVHQEGLVTDLMTVTNRLRDDKKLDSVGGQAKIVSLFERTVSAVTVDQLALIVMDKYIRRRLMHSSTVIHRNAADTSKPLVEVVEDSEKRIFEVSQARVQRGYSMMSDVLAPMQQDLVDRSLGLVLPGIACGFYDLDALTQGFQRSDLIIIAGRPSMGKTSFTMNIARNLAAIQRLPVIVFSLEMSQEQLVQRFLSSEVRVETGRLRAGRIFQNEWEPIGHAIGSMSQLPIAIDDTPEISLTEMRSKARRFVTEMGGMIGGIFLDYLQLMTSGKPENRVQDLSAITRGLKSIGRELNVPVFAISQLSRTVESRTNKRPMMSDLRESGSIEQDADLVLMLYRDEYYNPETYDRGIAEVIIAKHRNGPTGTIKLLFENQFTQFRNLAHGGNA